MRGYGLLLLTTILFLSGCGGSGGSSTVEDPGPPRPIATASATLAPGAVALDPEGHQALIGFDADAGRVVFSTTSPVLNGLAAGDTLIIGPTQATPHGAMLTVEAIVPQGDGLLLETRAAALEEAFEDLSVRLRTSVTAIVGIDGGLTFPLEFSTQNQNGQLRLDGSFSVAPAFDLDLDFNFFAFKLSSLNLSFTAREAFLAEVIGQGNASFSESVPLGTIPFAPIIIPIPGLPVPVVLIPQVAIQAGVNGSTSGDVEVSIMQEAGFTVGVGYRNGEFGGFSDSDSSFNFEEPVYSGAASIKATAGARMEILIYGTVGPYAGADAFLELAASAEGPPPCVNGVVNAGMGGVAGVRFIGSYETTLFNKTHPVASFDTCNAGPNAPRPAITWARSFGRVGSAGERAKAVIEVSDGTYLVVGDSDRFGDIESAAAGIWAVRLDALGNVLWQRAYSRHIRQGLTMGVQEVPGGFLIAGTSGVMKIDAGGSLVWARGYDGPIETASIVAHEDGSFLVAGRYGLQSQAWAMKLASNGDVLWSNGYGGANFARVRRTADGGYILVGRIASNNNDMFLVKLDANGGVTWKRAIDNRYDSTGEGQEPLSSIDRGLDVMERPGGGFIAVGDSLGSFPIPAPGQAPFSAAWIAEVDAQGTLLDSTVYRTPVDSTITSAYGVGVRPNGSVIVVGRRAERIGDLLEDEDVLIIQGGAFSALGGDGNDAVHLSVTAANGMMPLQLTSDGGAIVVATSDSFAAQNQVWVIKLNRAGGINMPAARVSLPGGTYNNGAAVSTLIGSGATAIPVQITPFTSGVDSEVTPVASAIQMP